MMDGGRQDALAQIVALARTHALETGEIVAALRQSSGAAPKNKVAVFFAAVGGIFVFSGILAFIGMFWDEMNSASRVVITLGSGFALFLMAIIATSAQEPRYRRAGTPLFLMAGWLQPVGLFVLIHEYFHGGKDPRYACLLVFTVMLVQQLACFAALRRDVLLFFSLLFGGSFFATVFSLLGVPNNWSAVIIGVSLLNISYALSQRQWRNLPGIGFFLGGSYCLGGAFDILQHSAFELLYLGMACFMVYLSTLVRSTMLMIVSVIAMLAYIGYFTEEHFVHSIGWPAALIGLGFIFIGTGIGAVKLRRRYI
ncbi:MAG: DUF2157 domain-containing protein [Pseudomonadota bacterium]|nr:DUF2157 domain-containing protein [Pseudomonadota bacterium]